MKKRFTLKGFFLRKEGWMSILVVTLFLFFGCYEFFLVDQPAEAYTDSSFEVPIVIKDDGDESNDWTGDNLIHPGIFGIMLPDGWEVMDSIYYTKTSTDNYPDEGYILHDEEVSQMLADSILPAPPANYHWWGGKTDSAVDMRYFDSIALTVTIKTGSEPGTYALRYSVGDVEYWERNPTHDVTDPIQIDLVENPVGILKAEDPGAEFNVYPNPSEGTITVDLKKMKARKADLSVFDLSGRMVLSMHLTETLSTVDLGELSSGTYLVRVESGSRSATRQVILK